MAMEFRADGGREVIPMRVAGPMPTRTRIKRLAGAIAVIRKWEPGDVALCRRCPSCDADGCQCVVLIDYPVKLAEAWDLDTRAVPYQAVASAGTGHSSARA